MLRLASHQCIVPESLDQSRFFADISPLENSDTKIICIIESETHTLTKHHYNEILNILKHNNSTSSLDAYIRFENALKEINDYLASISLQIHGIIALQEKNELHVAQSGGAEAYLIRRGKLNVIIEQDPNDAMGFISISSGELLIDDSIVFSSLRLLRKATASQIVEAFSKGTLEGIEDMKTLLESENEPGGIIASHIRGESIFTQMEKTFASENITRNAHHHWIRRFIDTSESWIQHIAEKTGKSYTFIKHIVFSLLLGVCLTILVFMVVFLSSDRSEYAETQWLKEQLLAIESDLQLASNQVHLNNITSANALIERMEQALAPIIASGKFNQDTLAIISTISDLRDKGNNIQRHKNMSERMLVSLPQEIASENIQGILWNNGKIETYTESSLVTSVLSAVESVHTLSPEKLVQHGFQVEGKGFYSLSSGGIVTNTQGSIVSVSTTDPQGFKPAVAYDSYLRNSYFLSPSTNMIWRYEWKQPLFTPPSPWITTEGVDLSKAIDLSVDGAIYVLTNEGQVLLLYRGAPSPLSINSNRQDILVGATKIYVKPDMKHVYFLKPEQKSVVVMRIVNRGLEYVSEIICETETPLTGISVDTNELRLFVSDKKHVYELSTGL